MTLKPLADLVVVKLVEAEETTKAGIILTSASQEKPQFAEVVAIGPGETKDGKLIPMNCKVGDQVLLPEYGGTPLKIDEEEYHLFCDCDILGKFE